RRRLGAGVVGKYSKTGGAQAEGEAARSRMMSGKWRMVFAALWCCSQRQPNWMTASSLYDRTYQEHSITVIAMAAHFLLSPLCRTLSVAEVARMSEDEAWRAFCRIRWAATGGSVERLGSSAFCVVPH